jgi:acyl-coenzyme A synthetase/AMP-(fatty) acid ligase/aryl carrier-like protein
VRRSDLEACRRHFAPSCVFVNRYSCTEAGSITVNRLDALAIVDEEEEYVPVGYPLPGKTVLIVDDQGAELPAGAVGEIAVRSRDLALGYWRDAEGTSAVFRPVPGSSEERLFLTGDLGRLRPDGCLEHLGRKDTRAKVRGFRIELDEIEAVLARHPAVQQAAAAVVAGPDGEDLLAGYVVAGQGADTSPGILRAYLAEHLPAASVPSRFVWLDALPLASSGKLDRQALPRDLAEARTAPVAAATASPLEAALAEMWKAVLAVADAGRDDEFLTQGGDSLKATRLLARVLERWNVEISFAEFLSAPTLAGLVALIERKQAEARTREQRVLEQLLDEIEAGPDPE